jgi:hypothetical protein
MKGNQNRLGVWKSLEVGGVVEFLEFEKEASRVDD